MNLEDYRKDIDNIDQKIVSLLDERLNTCKEIGKYKKENNLPVLDSKREEEKIKSIKDNELTNSDLIAQIYEKIMEVSKKVQ